MIGVFNTIIIDGTEILRPNDFELQREDVFAGEYTTMTGKTIADRIGWKYSDMTLKWDILTDEMLQVLTELAGEVTIEFEDNDGRHSEQILRKGFANMPTRTTGPEGTPLWTGIEMDIAFLNTHTIDEE